MNILRSVGKVLLFLSVSAAFLLINISSSIPFRITLPFGWSGSCYNSYIGFPFSLISNPPPGTFCEISLNFAGLALNLLFFVLLIFAIYFIFKKNSSKTK